MINMCSIHGINAVCRRTSHFGFTLIVALGVTGCMQPADTMPPSRGKTAARTEDAEGVSESNIVRVNKFFSSDPWLSFSGDGTNRIDGVRFNLYLESATKPEGVFGTGHIVVSMYRIDHDPARREVAVPLHEWNLSPQDAYPWRAKKKTALGWGYGMRLQWGDKVDVAGKTVAFVIKYVREDGKVISSSRQVLKVPNYAKPSLLG
jgi:hypothetical protein